MTTDRFSLSGTLILNVKSVYEVCVGVEVRPGWAINRYPDEKGKLKPIPVYRVEAFAAYVVAVAALEAFINETLLSDEAKEDFFPESPLWNQGTIEELESKTIRDKMLDLPRLLFGETFDTSKQPYQDADTLVVIRNTIVHYRIGRKPSRKIQDLVQRGIALPHKDFPWIARLASTEGARWAHNTVCAVVKNLLSYAPDSYESYMQFFAEDFQPID